MDLTRHVSTQEAVQSRKPRDTVRSMANGVTLACALRPDVKDDDVRSTSHQTRFLHNERLEDVKTDESDTDDS